MPQPLQSAHLTHYVGLSSCFLCPTTQKLSCGNELPVLEGFKQKPESLDCRSIQAGGSTLVLQTKEARVRAHPASRSRAPYLGANSQEPAAGRMSEECAVFWAARSSDRGIQNLCRPRYLIFTTFSQVVKIVSRRVLSESFLARSTFKAGQAL